MEAFRALGLKAQFIRALEDLQFQSPTEIQTKVIKPILGGQEIVATAPTGSGKTAAYFLPTLQQLKGSNPNAVRILVIAPTKELALQIKEMGEKLSAYTDLKFNVLIGGIGKKHQREMLAEGTDVLVATPGRLMDMYLEGAINLKKLAYLILDEGDRLLDMGFMPQLNSILEFIPRKSKTLIFSATFPDRLNELVENFIEYPTKVAVSSQEKPAETVHQQKVPLLNRLTKLSYLEDILKEEAYERVIVFTRTKDIATQTYKYLERKGMGDRVGVLHANKGQHTRTNTFTKFREGQIKVLVTTDISARGVDIPKVSHVINFDVPLVKEEYVHRVGRTGRAGNHGVSMTFYTEVEQFQIAHLEEYTGQEMDLIHVEVAPRDFLPGEEKEIRMKMDLHRQRLDPEYRGAFHERKKKIYPPKKK